MCWAWRMLDEVQVTRHLRHTTMVRLPPRLPVSPLASILHYRAQLPLQPYLRVTALAVTRMRNSTIYTAPIVLET